MPLDAKALADATAEIVTRHVAQATAPLLKRIEALESRPMPETIKGDKGDSIKGEPGVGVAGALIDRSGVLVLTLSDGTTKDLGPVVGKDAAEVDLEAIERSIDKKVAEAVDAIPKPKDGKNGFSLDDFDVNAGDDGRTVVLSFGQGEQRLEAELKFPVPQYRDIFKAGTEYEPGDLVTWGGCLWHCNEKTTDKPDAGPWTLAVKKGRDGKDAK